VEEVFGAVPVQYRYSGDIFSGEKRSDLLVVPALSVRVSPEVAIIPASSLRQPSTAGRGGRRGAPPAAAASSACLAGASCEGGREVRVTVVNGSPGASESTVSLDLPDGWTATPPQLGLKLARSDESQTLRFLVKPPLGAKAGEYRVRALVKQGDATFDRGYQVIEYPHIRRQHIYEAASTTIKVIDVNTIPNLTIGYVMGVGDQVPPAIEQLGARVEFVSPDDLAWGNLSRFDAIVTGVRAYERRADLRANNNRLLDYVNNGGTLIVQYNKFEFNEAQYGPYPAKVSNDRVTDEHAPVKVLNENSPLLNAPNRINEETWKGWVQERGLYFLDADHDSRYKDLLEISDPFEYNKGAKKGALVEAQYGKGHWVYVGLGLWRELPAGVDGSYQLLANLVGLGKTSALPSPSGAPPSGRGK
jgi:alpha-galactosidase-like protein